MERRAHEVDPLNRASALIHEHKLRIVERWERRVIEDARAGRPALAMLRGLVAVLIDRIVLRLQRAVGEPLERAKAHGDEGSECAWDVPAGELPSALDQLAHFRSALIELCALENARLDGDAALVVHGVIDEAMAALARSAEQERAWLEKVLQLLPVGVFIADPRGRLAIVNDAAHAIWGPDLPLARSATEYGTYHAYRPGERDPLPPEAWGLARALRGEDVLEEELEVLSFDGVRKTILNSALALRGPDGAIEGGVAVNVDVTDRRRTARQLAAIIEGALDAIVLLDAAGLVTEFNPAAERIFGYSRSDAIGHELAELIIEPSLRERHRRGLERYLATGESRILGRRVEMHALDATGARLDTELTVIALPPGGPALFAGFVRDITAHKRAEADRAHAAALRERFVDILGHDLRTPLAVVSFTAASLLRHETSETRSRALQRIANSADRMDRMIRDLLDFARSHHGSGIPVTPRAADLEAICRHVIEDVELTHAGRSIELRSRGDAHGRWDPDRIAQVVQNLVVNAVDYSPGNTPVKVAIDGSGKHVVLTVNNAGRPIAAEMRRRLFEPFHGGVNASSGKAPSAGLGLGLYIAHAIVSAHHGRIDVGSGAERGTTFLVELPR